MFTATNYRTVLALTLCFVVSAEAQQRGGQQRGCLTPREAFQVNEAGAPLCKTQNKATTPAGNATRGSAATATAPNAGATTQTTGSIPKNNEPPQVVEPIPSPQRGNQNVSTVTLVSLPPLVLKYSLLKSSGTGDLVAANLATEFRTGDRIRLNVESNEQAYLYILAEGASGKWNMSLFPNEKINGGQNLVPAHKPYQVPADRGIEFKDPPGQERLIIILSRRPIQDLEKEKLRDSRGNPGPTQIAAVIDDSTVGGIRVKARDLELEDSSTEFYVANGNGAADDLVLADVTLKHK